MPLREETSSPETNIKQIGTHPAFARLQYYAKAHPEQRQTRRHERPYLGGHSTKTPHPTRTAQDCATI
jgi:hypothetical protein